MRRQMDIYKQDWNWYMQVCKLLSMLSIYDTSYGESARNQVRPEPKIINLKTPNKN